MVRKHAGIIQAGINKGKLKKGYRYSSKKTLKNLPIILKIHKTIKNNKYNKIHIGGVRDYSYCPITNNKSDIDKINIFLKENPQKIPKIIHQIWIGPKPIPWKWINSFKIDFLSKYPDWKHYLWTDSNINTLDLINNAAYLDCKSYNGKSDILRYELLHQYGGIYIDADSEWLGKDLNNLINETENGFFIGNEFNNKNGFASGVVGSSINNPITSHLVHTMNKIYFRCNKIPAYKSIGPYFVDQALKEFNITVFPSYYFYPIYWHDNKSFNMSIEKQKKKYPNSYMTQYGLTTNQINTESFQ